MAAEATEAVAQTTVAEFLDFVLALVLDLERLPPGELRHSWFEEAGRVLANRDYDRHSLTPRRWVGFEISASCNLECVFCSVRGGYDPSRTMPFDLFKRLAGELLPSAQWARLNGLGEATIIPGFPEYVRHLARFPVRKEIVTNLMSQDEQVYSMLFDMGFLILVSWDGASAETFESLRRGADFDLLCRRLAELGSRATRGSQSERLLLIFTLVPENLAELTQVVKLARDRGAGGVLVNMAKTRTSAQWQSDNRKAIIDEFDRARRTISHDHKFNLALPDLVGGRPTDMTGCTRTSASGCSRWCQEVMIRFDGGVGPCNMLNPYLYGWSTGRRVDQVLAGPAAELFRRFVNTDLRHPFCNGCSYLYVSDPHRDHADV